MKIKYAKICPECHSLNIRIRWQSLWFFGLPPTFKCMNCNYTANIFPEIELTADNIKKLIKQAKKEKLKRINKKKSGKNTK